MVELDAYAGARGQAEGLLDQRGQPIQRMADQIMEQVETCREAPLLKIGPFQAARLTRSER